MHPERFTHGPSVKTESNQYENNPQFKQLSYDGLRDAKQRLKEAAMFNNKNPEHALIDQEATEQALTDYLMTGNLEEALTFFDSNNVPELEEEFKGISGRKAFKKLLEVMGVPLPPVLESV